jgi:hypothetical protein
LIPREIIMSSSTLEETGAAPVRSVVTFPLSHGRLVLGLQGEAAPWVEPALRTLGNLFLLPVGWDSYGGRAPDPSCVLAAWRLLTAVMRDDSPTPAVVPTARGSVQLEWHRNGVDLEIEVVAPRVFVVSFEVRETGEAWEKTLTEDFAELSALMDRVAEKSEPARAGGPAHDRNAQG